jgi:hypothetical protein
MSNRDLFGDKGSDESSVEDRARAAGFSGAVAETVAIIPALAISGIEILQQWYYNPATLRHVGLLSHHDGSVVGEQPRLYGGGRRLWSAGLTPPQMIGQPM